MPPTPRQVADFGVALREATLLDVRVAIPQRGVSLTFAVLSLPAGDGPEPEDPRIRLVLSQVGRIAGSLRRGPWDDPSSPVERFPVEQLPTVVESFGQQPVYGWDCLDMTDSGDWDDRLSFDWRSEPNGLSHSLTLFRVALAGGGDDRELRFRIWFDHLRIKTPDREDVPFEEFTAGGARWWKAMREGDPRTEGHGIFPAAPWPGHER